MKSFSQRKGLKPVKSVIQVDSMDDNLRIKLWNNLHIFYWQNVITGFRNSFLKDFNNRSIVTLIMQLWKEYFINTLDTLSDDWDEVYKVIKEYFFKCTWSEAYDLIEFVSWHYPVPSFNIVFIESCNRILAIELSGYRFVGGKITQITSEVEISEIQQALEIPVSPVQEHLKQALDLLADRKNPDYRNSIKEAISAVESMCKLIVKIDKATLPQALQEIERGGVIEFHPALKAALDKLYAFTSDEDGIRHGMLDEPNLSFEDAKFMLVSCSAFVNYLVIKTSKAGIII